MLDSAKEIPKSLRGSAKKKIQTGRYAVEGVM